MNKFLKSLFTAFVLNLPMLVIAGGFLAVFSGACASVVFTEQELAEIANPATRAIDLGFLVMGFGALVALCWKAMGIEMSGTAIRRRPVAHPLPRVRGVLSR